MQSKICAIIVTYNPEIDTLKKCVGSLVNQVDKIYIIDNSNKDFTSAVKNNFNKKKIRIIFLKENKGIAYAQNIGIKLSLKKKCDFILFSDQDTIYPENYVENMISTFTKLGGDVFAVVPNFINVYNNYKKQGFILFTGLFIKKIFPEKGTHNITQAISSGMIVKANLIDKVGYLNEDLFIDWVDLEWCWRARSKGYNIIGVADVNILHSLGYSTKRIFGFVFPFRTPLRHYYITRNAIYLALRNRVINLPMRLNLIGKAIMYVIIYTLFGKPHIENLRNTLKGFSHGVLGKTGKLEEKIVL